MCELFGAEHANVQPHSGANANLAVYLALLEPGDTVLGMRLDQGGHLTHGSPVNVSGQWYHFVCYGVTASDERIDYEALAELAEQHRPKLIVAGATAYSRIIDPEPLRRIADDVGALLIFDAAHIAGLIAGGVHPNPVGVLGHRHLHHPQDSPWTSRRLHPVHAKPAPRPSTRPCSRACRVARSNTSSRPRRSPSTRRPSPSSPNTRPRSSVNARALAEAVGGEGFRIVSGGTDNHLMLVDLRTFDADLTGKVAQEALDKAGITLQPQPDPGRPAVAVHNQRSAARHGRRNDDRHA